MNIDAVLRLKANVSGENNIKRLGNSMQGVQGKVKNLQGSVGKLAGAFKALVAAAAIGGFANWVKSAIDAADALGKLEVRTGIAAGKLQAYVNAGKLADVSQKQLVTGLRTLARTQQEAADGTASYEEAYKKLGVEVKKSDGTLKDTDKLLAEISDRFATLPDGPEKAALAMDLFGKSGADMITLLNGGSESLERFNFQLSEKFAQNAEYYNDKITEMMIAFEGFQMQLMDALLPALISITEVFTELFTEGEDVDAMFVALEVTIRGFAATTFATVKLLDAFVKNLIAAGDIWNKLSSGDIFGALDVYGQRFREYGKEAEENFALLNKILTERGEAPEGYGRRTRGRFQVDDVFGGGEKAKKTAKERAKLSEELFFFESRILDAREQQNEYAEALAKLDLEIYKATKLYVDDPLQAQLDLRNAEITATEKLRSIDEDRVKQAEDLMKGIDAFNASLADMVPETEGLKELWSSIGNVITSNVAGAIEGAIFEAKSLQESLSGILRSLASVFIQFGTKSLLGGLFPSANGNVFAQNKIVPFAYGGVVKKPTLFPMANGMGLMGEAGPEAIMPLRRTSSGRLGVEATGGTSNIVVNVDASGTRVQGDDTRGKQLGGAISAAVQAELIKQRRPGGLLAS